MYLARSSPTVLTWFMDASLSGLQRPHSGTPRPPGASTPSNSLWGGSRRPAPAAEGLGHGCEPDPIIRVVFRAVGPALIRAPAHGAGSIRTRNSRRFRPPFLLGQRGSGRSGVEPKPGMMQVR